MSHLMPAADSGAHHEAPGWDGQPARMGMASVNTVVTPSEISSNSRFSAACYAYETVRHAQQGLERYVQFYNQLRPHRALDGRPPDCVYWDNRPAQPAAE